MYAFVFGSRFAYLQTKIHSMQPAPRKPYLTYVRTVEEQPPLQVAGRNAPALPQTPISFPAAVTRDRLLADYQLFIDAAIENGRTVYRDHVQRGGRNSFFEFCWTLLLNDAVEKAEALVNEHACSVQEKERLLRDFKRIAEGCLLVLDRALA